MKCTGCGACALACKTENNTQSGIASKENIKWADFYMKSEGKFPDVKYTVFPTRCNHCDDPACLKPCPEPKALYKTEEGITMYNYRYCIQCKKCMPECPYSDEDIEKAGAQFSAIYFNEVGVDTHPFYKDKTELIKGGTSSPAEVAGKAGTPPHKHAYTFRDDKPPAEGQKSRGRGEVADVRSGGWVDKCHFCIHRIRKGEEPYCVVSCPARARIVGDKNDPNSEVSKLLKQHKALRLKNNKGEFLADGEEGTGPNMFYIKSYSARK